MNGDDCTFQTGIYHLIFNGDTLYKILLKKFQWIKNSWIRNILITKPWIFENLKNTKTLKKDGQK